MSLDLSMTRKKTGVWYITVTQYDGTTPQDLTGSVLWFHAVVGGVTISKNSPASGITITSAAGGLATLQIEPTDTTTVAAGSQVGPCELTLVNGSESYEVASGTLTIAQEVATP